MRGKAHIIAAALLACSANVRAAEQAPICADRPSKSTGPCTVPTGKWQLETGLIDWSRQSSGGVITDDIVWGNTAIKYGISSKADVELWLTPLLTEHVHGSGVHAHSSSFGDTLVRLKYALSSDDAPVQVALDPFVKIPTANHQLGNGKVEGGLLVPIEVPIGKGPLTLAFDPELDLLANSDGSGHHLATQQLVNLGIAASKKLSFSTEIWAMWDWDPASTGKMVSWDASAAYLLTNDLQLDAGANVGLNKQTPGIELYTGISARF